MGRPSSLQLSESPINSERSWDGLVLQAHDVAKNSNPHSCHPYIHTRLDGVRWANGDNSRAQTE